MYPQEKDRYARQILFHGLGEAGQERFLQAHVAVVGCGALGSFQGGALARAGIGRLVLIDRDYVELSNLQREWLFEESDARDALPKAVAAARRVAAINSGVTVQAEVRDLTPANIDDLLEGVDLILDGTDNFETRYLINDYSVSKGIPWIYGAAVGSYGIAMPIVPGVTACLKCVYPEPPSGAQPTCETAGVLNTITSLIASLQVSLAYQLLAGAPLSKRLTTVDLWTGIIRQIEQPAADPECVACGRREFVHLRGQRVPISLCGRNAVQIHERANPLDLVELADRLSALG